MADCKSVDTLSWSRGICVAGIVSLLAACGGGGGGATTSPPAPPPPPPPPVSGPAALSTSNAILAFREQGLTADAPYTLATSVVSRLLDYMTAGNSTEACNLGGSVTTSLIDADGSNDVSAGDTFRVDYLNDCFDVKMNDLVTGSVTFLVTELVVRNSGHIIAGRLATASRIRTDSSIFDVTLEGAFDVFSFNSSNATILASRLAAGTTADLTWIDHLEPSITNVVELTVFDASKTTRLEADPALTGTLFELDMTLDSSALGGTIECATPKPAVAPHESYPVFGAFVECAGAASSRVRIVADTLPGGGSPNDKIFADSGAGSLVEVDRISRVMHQIFAHRVSGSGPPSELPAFGTLNSQRVQIDITDSAYDPASDRVFVIEAADLVVYDATTLAEIERLTLLDITNRVAISDDGSTLWLAARDKPEIRSVDTASLSYQDLVSYSSPGPGSSGIDYIYDLEVLPGTTDILVATLNHRDEIVVINAGVELPGTLPLQNAFRGNFAVLNASSLVANGGNQSLPTDLRLVSIDLAAGLTVQAAYTNFVPAFALLHAANSETVVARSRVIDLARGSVSSQLENLGFEISHLASDTGRNRLYAIRNEQQLLVYELDTRKLLGAYSLDQFSLGALRRIHVAGENMLFSYESTLLRVAASDVMQNRGIDACNTEDLSGLILPGTAFQVDCKIESAVYDHSRERLLIGIGGDNGLRSNSIGIVEPQTGALEAFIPVGGVPGMMRLTDDNRSLLVLVAGANEITVVDLDAKVISNHLALGINPAVNGVPAGPAIASAVAPLAGGADDFLVALGNGAVARYLNGERLADEHVGADAYVDVFISLDHLSAAAVFRDQSSILNILATGTTERVNLGGIFAGPFTKRNVLQQLGDELFVFNGDVFDLPGGSVSSPCTIDDSQMRDQVATPSTSGDSFIVAAMIAGGFELQLCNRNDGTDRMLRPLAFFSSDDAPVFVGGFLNNSGLMMLVSTQWVMIVDPFT